jgi:hypothetical protein
MKKTVTVALALVFVLGLLVSGALADTYDYPDNTKVQEWVSGSVYGSGAWKDVIAASGDVSFDTFGADYSNGILTIYTNWDPGKDGDVSTLVKTADLFIGDCNGDIDYAIRLDDNVGTGNKGYVFDDPGYKTSDDIYKGTSGLIYGGRYDEGNPKPVPVEATTGFNGTTTSVVWTLGTGDLNNKVAIDLSGLNLDPKWSFIWGTANCANDGFSDCVPIPPSMLLMGSGLLGMGLLGWRRRSSKDQVS